MKCELKDLIEKHESNIIRLDLKETLNINLDDSIQHDELKKFIYYETLKGKIDIDACKTTTEIYLCAWKWNDIMKDWILSEDPVQQKYSNLKYEIHLKGANNSDEQAIFRGDTMNNAWTIIKQAILLSKNKADVYEKKGINSSKALTDQLNLLIHCIYEFELIANNKEQFDLLSKNCHCLGNFIPFPTNVGRSKQNLNQIRGLCKLNDFWDLTLKSIYLWYQDNVNPLKDILDINAYWLNSFGEGEEGWKNFINYNYLEDFITESYKPKMFWSNHSFKSSKSSLPENEDEIREFLSFVNKAIYKRGEKIYSELKRIIKYDKFMNNY